MFQSLAAAGFQSIWYWVLHVVVWTLACSRTLGVPHDMLIRARRMPDVADRVDILAQVSAERIGGIHDSAGVPIAAATGFLLATLAALGFATGIESAQAILAILLPLAAIGYSKLRLALYLRRRRVIGPRLVLLLSRRRVWHQVISVLAMLAALSIAWRLHPPLPPL